MIGTNRLSWSDQILAVLKSQLQSYLDQSALGVVRRHELQLRVSLHQPGASVVPIVPDIVIEIYPRTARLAMVHRAIRQHLSSGVREIWDIELPARSVEVWTSTSLSDGFEGSQFLTPALLPGSIEELF